MLHVHLFKTKLVHVQIIEKNIKIRIRMGWSAFDRQHNVMKSNFPEKEILSVYSFTSNIKMKKPAVLRKLWNENFKVPKGKWRE